MRQCVTEHFGAALIRRETMVAAAEIELPPSLVVVVVVVHIFSRRRRRLSLATQQANILELYRRCVGV